jgi:hypothetical protein
MKLPTAAYSAEVVTSATKAGTHPLFGTRPLRALIPGICDMLANLIETVVKL